MTDEAVIVDADHTDLQLAHHSLRTVVTRRRVTVPNLAMSCRLNLNRVS